MTPGGWSDPAGQDSWEDLSKWGKFDGEPWPDEKPKEGEEQDTGWTGITRVIPADLALTFDWISPALQMLLTAGTHEGFQGTYGDVFELQDNGITCDAIFEVAFDGTVCWAVPNFQAARAKRILGMEGGQQ